MTESIQKDKIYAKGGRILTITSSCVLKIIGHEDVFYGSFTQSIVEANLWKVSDRDEKEMISKARKECLRNLRQKLPGIFDGMGIEAERG